ncbi:hypothetical protein A1O3_06095 [Capronia epimyces CBS 606.96]|uniref:Uncharacterized protein n=1 Tax=Capronia epimyces CBS 606.96 TaxID=1182542 RepID=W9XP09_9EURO|nr:uncharacterized protein A1O3_06095 [Capronia epimyces CBS 606.96]EXJ82282.1 hypothetical protein A1O3_06095 [Capronia epimyces CBS 606.96]
MLPVVLETDGISIFIALFRALVDDMVQRFVAAGVNCREWKATDAVPARLLVVNADIVTDLGLSRRHEAGARGGNFVVSLLTSAIPCSWTATGVRNLPPEGLPDSIQSMK